jgi:putative aldouronate transport system substrate-binding protein
MIMKKTKKALTIATVLLLCLALASCKKEPVINPAGVETLTYWRELPASAAASVSNFGDTVFAQKLQELTGVKIEYIHPPTGQAAEKFSVLTASKNLPDIIEYRWVTGYPGGPEKAVSDGVIIDIGLHDEYAPNLFGVFKNDSYNDKLSKTDSGKYFGFPHIFSDVRMGVSSGLTLRYDWLAELELDIPETLDEWTETLTAFRDKKGAPVPLLMHPDFQTMIMAFDIMQNYYVDGALLKYGMAQPAYKEYLEFMNGWYNQGLIDKDFAALESKKSDYNILNGLSGALTTNMGGGIGRLTAAAENGDFILGAAPFPVKNKGGFPEYSIYSNSTVFAAITASCKNIETAMRFLDASYDKDGAVHLLNNFGIEGVSYEMVDGYPAYTDLITKNPEGKSMQEAMANYICAFSQGPYIQDYRYFEQYAQLPSQKEAIRIWSGSNGRNHIVPHIYVKQEELNELARLSNDVETFAKEMNLKFIMGLEPVSNFDSYIEQLKARGLDRLLEIQQAALDRFNSK